VAVYAVLLVRANSPIAGGADSSGYLNEARLLARGRVSEEIAGLALLGLPPADPDLFIPLGYRSGPTPGTMAPRYPPGLPLQMALLGKIGGWTEAPFLAAPIAAIASLLLLYAVARQLGLSPGLSAAGALMLAVCPIFFGMAVQPMSDVPATAWVLAAIYFGLRARRSDRWAVAAGAALGVAVIVRPTNALAVIPLLFALPPGWRAIGRSFAGGAPFAVLLLLYNSASFGGATSTGYEAILTRTMSAANVWPEIRHHGFWLGALLTPLVPLAWLGVGFDRRVPGRDRALLLTWFGAFFVFYCFYEVYDDWWAVRFLLPGIPAMILAALLVARDVSLPAKWKRVVGPALLAGIVAVGVGHIVRFHLFSIGLGERVYRDASRGAAGLVPARSLIAAMQMSGALKYYAERPILRSDRVRPEHFAAIRRRAEGRGIPLYALLWPFEVADLDHMPGDWEPVSRWRDVVLYRLR
jgi:4-amino-4-deoxy-L-arabinose transferase-like glycosyltransferase